jgi:hypothetical protein
VFTKRPADAAVGFPLHYEVTLKDDRDHTVMSNSDQIKFTLIPSPSGSGVLASNVDTLASGIADNGNNLVSVSADGTYSLSVIDVPANPSDAPAAGATSKTFVVKPLK